MSTKSALCGTNPTLCATHYWIPRFGKSTHSPKEVQCQEPGLKTVNSTPRFASSYSTRLRRLLTTLRFHRRNTLHWSIIPVAASQPYPTIAHTSKMAICPISVVKFVGTISLGLMTVSTSPSRYTCADTKEPRTILPHEALCSTLPHPDRPILVLFRRLHKLTPPPTRASPTTSRRSPSPRSQPSPPLPARRSPFPPSSRNPPPSSSPSRRSPPSPC